MPEVTISISQQLWELLDKESAKIQSQTSRFNSVESTIVGILENWADPADD